MTPEFGALRSQLYGLEWPAGWVSTVIGLLVVATFPCLGGPAEAQTAHLKNFQHLVCNYSLNTGELTVALLSTSAKTDPAQEPGLASSIEVQLELDGEPLPIIEAKHLKTAVLGTFRAEADRKYRLFRFNLVIDESTSIETPELIEARRIIDKFLRRIPVVYEAQIIRFSTSVQPPSAFTNDVDALRQALGQGNDRLIGGTDFYNAMERALRELTSANRGETLPLQFTIAFTDGADTSGREFEPFKRSLQQMVDHEQIFLFIAGIGGEGEIQHDQLRQLPGSRGIYYELSKVPEVDQVFDAIAQMLDKTYVLRIPTVSSHKGANKLYIVRKKATGGGRETIQDIHLPPRCVPP
ncbi:MAG: vWA domain-containing protein [Acidobacteriota bacterium]|nr:vWA domain-containing protein [Acidobacteriota bacterium]